MRILSAAIFLLFPIAQGHTTVPMRAVENKVPRIEIPDSQLKIYLVAEFDTSGDGEISLAEAEAASAPVNVANRNIKDLTGNSRFEGVPIKNKLPSEKLHTKIIPFHVRIDTIMI